MLTANEVILRWAPGSVLQNEVFARNSNANLFDGSGILRTVGPNIKREVPFNAHYINGVETALREPLAVNIVVAPRDLQNAAWVKTSCTPNLDQVGIDGNANSASSLVATGPNATCLQTVVLASSARCQSVFIKRLAGVGAIQMTTDNGVTWTNIAVANNYSRVRIPTQTLANPVFGFRIVTSGDAVAIDYTQNEGATDPSTPIIGTRQADQCTALWTVGPKQPITVYAKYIEQTTDVGQKRFFRMGNGDATGSLILYVTAGLARLRHNNATSTVEGNVAYAAVVGDVVELRGVYLPSGACYISCTVNGGAEVVGATTTALAPIAAWGAPIIEFSSAQGSAVKNWGLLAFRVFVDEKTLSEVRSDPTSAGSIRGGLLHELAMDEKYRPRTQAEILARKKARAAKRAAAQRAAEIKKAEADALAAAEKAREDRINEYLLNY